MPPTNHYNTQESFSTARRVISIGAPVVSLLILGFAIVTLSASTEEYAYGAIDSLQVSSISTITGDSQLAYFSGGGTGGNSNMGNTTGKSPSAGRPGGVGNNGSTNSTKSPSGNPGGGGDPTNNDNGTRKGSTPSGGNGNNTTDPDKQGPGSTRGGDKSSADAARKAAVSKAQEQAKSTEKQNTLGDFTRALNDRFNFSVPSTPPTTPRSITPSQTLTDKLTQPYNMGDTAVKAVAEKVAMDARIAAHMRTEALADALTKNITPQKEADLRVALDQYNQAKIEQRKQAEVEANRTFMSLENMQKLNMIKAADNRLIEQAQALQTKLQNKIDLADSIVVASEIRKAVVGEAGLEYTAADRIAIANTIMNRLSLAVTAKTKVDVHDVLDAFDANMQRAKTLDNKVYSTAELGTEANYAGADALNSVLNGNLPANMPDAVKNATHYKTPEVHPKWAEGVPKTKYGPHEFMNADPGVTQAKVEKARAAVEAGQIKADVSYYDGVKAEKKGATPAEAKAQAIADIQSEVDRARSIKSKVTGANPTPLTSRYKPPVVSPDKKKPTNPTNPSIPTPKPKPAVPSVKPVSPTVPVPKPKPAVPSVNPPAPAPVTPPLISLPDWIKVPKVVEEYIKKIPDACNTACKIDYFIRTTFGPGTGKPQVPRDGGGDNQFPSTGNTIPKATSTVRTSNESPISEQSWWLKFKNSYLSQ